MSEREAQLSEAHKHKEIMESLINHDGWKLIDANLTAQILERTSKLEDPLSSADLIYLHEYMKGARQAFRFIQALPKSIMDTASEVIEAINKETPEEEEENGEEESDTSGEE